MSATVMVPGPYSVRLLWSVLSPLATEDHHYVLHPSPICSSSITPSLALVFLICVPVIVNLWGFNGKHLSESPVFFCDVPVSSPGRSIPHCTCHSHLLQILVNLQAVFKTSIDISSLPVYLTNSC